MSHLDDDAIARAAMEDEGIDERAHLGVCAECAGRLVDLRALMVSLAAAGPVELVAPPERVWDAIRADIADDARADAVVPLASRRRVAPGWLAAAAAAGVVLGVDGASLLQNVGGAPDATVLARASLEDLDTLAPAGDAVIEETGDGHRVLVIDTAYTDLTDAYLEVWLIDPNVEGMVSLGHLTDPHGEFALPDGLDAAAFPIVDISIEHNDGVPTHSGDSVIRGVLDL